jgi:hypothetical protein
LLLEERDDYLSGRRGEGMKGEDREDRGGASGGTTSFLGRLTSTDDNTRASSCPRSPWESLAFSMLRTEQMLTS